jgi:hypothetical protein
MICFRLLDSKDPAQPLADAVRALAENKSTSDTYEVEPVSFRHVPNAPFAYWVSNKIRKIFSTNSPLKNDGREAWMGLATGDNFQWVRLCWEIAPKKDWIPLAKGGGFSQYYSDLHLVVNWSNNGQTINDWKQAQFQMRIITENNSKCWNQSKYLRPGLSWSSRTQSGLSMRVIPLNSIFGNKGPAILVESNEELPLMSLLSLTNSKAFRGLVELQMAFGSYEVGVIQRTAVPNKEDSRLPKLATNAWRKKRKPDTAELTSHAFYAPALAPSRVHSTPNSK